MAYNFEKLSVLVVDDNQPMRELIASMFAIFGCDTIDEARDGQEAYDIFYKGKHDLVISDWRMSPMDGITLLNKIRNAPDSPNPYVPFLMVSGYNNLGAVLEARDHGTTEYLMKPFSANDLYRRVVTIIERPRQFVKADTFFGPDRRRHKSSGYQGGLKRETDIKPEDFRAAQNDFEIDFIAPHRDHLRNVF